MSPFICSPSFENFKALKFLNDLVFHQVHPMNMYFHRRGHVFVIQKIEINCMILCFPFDYFKNLYFKHLIPSLYNTQNDINIVSKLFKIFLLIFRRHHFIYWHTTIDYNYNNVRLKKKFKVVLCNPFSIRHSFLVPQL